MSSFNLRPRWPPASRCDCTHLQRAPHQATSPQASQQTCQRCYQRWRPDWPGSFLRLKISNEWISATWAPGRMALKPQDWRFVISFRSMGRFGSSLWLQAVHKQFFFRFSILEAPKGIALFPISFWSLLYLLHLCIVDFNCIYCSVARAVFSISSEGLDGQIQVVSNRVLCIQGTEWVEVSSRSHFNSLRIVAGCFWANVGVEDQLKLERFGEQNCAYRPLSQIYILYK